MIKHKESSISRLSSICCTFFFFSPYCSFPHKPICFTSGADFRFGWDVAVSRGHCRMLTQQPNVMQSHLRRWMANSDKQDGRRLYVSRSLKLGGVVMARKMAREKRNKQQGEERQTDYDPPAMIIYACRSDPPLPITEIRQLVPVHVCESVCQCLASRTKSHGRCSHAHTFVFWLLSRATRPVLSVGRERGSGAVPWQDNSCGRLIELQMATSGRSIWVR